MSRFYVTTPIYYVNATPHLGTFYTTVVADALARYHRARYRPESTFFLTGLDEHGQKIERMARERGVEPQAYCDGIAAQFIETWKKFGVSQDDFIRTTSLRHKQAVAEMWGRMNAAGDIYLGEYEGLYCVGCEEAKSEDDLVTEGGEKVCPVHRRPVERVKEKNYFFRLSKYQDRLLELYERPDFIRPEARRNEVAEFVRRGLRDISVSRQTVKWGIPVPGDPRHVIYVWIDALTNYLTALGGPTAVGRGEGRGGFWAGSHHLIAKDILRFHAVYWPAMLMSVGLPMPKSIFCHGYLTVKGQKISKSLPATRVDPNRIAEELGVDPLRYFVLREYAFGGDGDFTYEALLQRYSSDLGNDLGNLLNRTVSMAHRYVAGQVAAAGPGPFDKGLPGLAVRCRREAEEAWERFAPSRALEATWELVRAANGFIEQSAPWAIAKDPNRLVELHDVLGTACEALRWCALMVAPAMPERSREMLRQLGRQDDEGTWPADWHWGGGTLAQPAPVFPRFDQERESALLAKWLPAEVPQAPAPAAKATGGAQPAGAPGATKAAATAGPAAPGAIGREEFERIDLRAAKVLSCERVPNTERLLRLTLDLGTEQRTVVSGIAGAYTPEALVGRTVVYLANLKPAKIRGIVSQGMVLAAGDSEVLGLATIDRDVPPGTSIR